MQYMNRKYHYLDRNPNIGSRVEKIAKEELSKTSREFIDSLKKFYEKWGGLTEKQIKSFEKIETAYAPEQKRAWIEWVAEYKSEYYKDSLIVAAYYAKQGYYTKISTNILLDNDYVPLKKAFLKMYNNKYAQKVLIATKAEPLFKVNDLVQLRATVGKNWSDQHLKKYRLRKCVVLKNDLPIKNAVNGAKRYKLLPMGSSETIECDERFLMKPNKRGKNS